MPHHMSTLLYSHMFGRGSSASDLQLTVFSLKIYQKQPFTDERGQNTKVTFPGTTLDDKLKKIRQSED